MEISGLQKLTLLDYPGRVACTIFTRGCNYRCPFCHNASLVVRADAQALIPEEEVLNFLEKRKGLLDGVCITGGEPMLQKDLEAFILRVKAMDYKVKLDTNGSFPERLQAIIEAGLVDYVAMDIKNTEEKYEETAGITKEMTQRTLKSVEILKKDLVPYEFRTTVVKDFHTEEDFEKIARHLEGARRYFLQKFVDSGDLIASGCSAPTDEEMRKYLSIVRKYLPQAELRGVEKTT